MRTATAHGDINGTTSFGRDYHVFESHGRQLLFSIDRSSVAEITDRGLFEILLEYEKLDSRDSRSPQELVEARPWPAARRALVRRALAAMAPQTRRPCDAAPYVPPISADRCQGVSMREITLFIAEACNFRCKYCYEGFQTGDRAPRLMSRTVAERAVDLLIRQARPKSKTLSILFFGGEPLLNMPVLRATVAYARQRAAAVNKQVTFGITTNGWLLTDSIIDYLCRNHFVVTVSIDGPAAIHDSRRTLPDGSGTHAIVARNLMRLQERMGSVLVRATRRTRSISSTELYQYFTGELGVTGRVLISEAMPTGVNNRDGVFAPDPSDYQWLVEDEEAFRAFAYATLAKGRPFLRDSFALFRVLNLSASVTYRTRCGVCANSTAVGADGTLYPCHRFWPMRDYIVGNVFDGFDHARVRSFFARYHTAVTQHCRECWCRYICQGMCARYNATEDGGFAAPPNARCDSRRKDTELALGWYVRMSREHPDWVKALCKETALTGGPSPGADEGEH